MAKRKHPIDEMGDFLLGIEPDEEPEEVEAKKKKDTEEI